MSVLIFVLPELSELCEPSWLPGIWDLTALDGACMLDPDRREHLGLKVLYALSLHQHCLWNVLELWNLHEWFLLVSIFVAPEIFCDSSDG